MTWTTGQTVHLVEVSTLSRSGVPRVSTAEVVKIGRVWITFKAAGYRERFDAKTGVVDPGEFSATEGRAFATHDQAVEWIALREAWAEFQTLVRGVWRAPSALASADVAAWTIALRAALAADVAE